MSKLPLFFINTFLQFTCSKQDLTKVHILHLVDMSLKSLLILQLPLPFLFLIYFLRKWVHLSLKHEIFYLFYCLGLRAFNFNLREWYQHLDQCLTHKRQPINTYWMNIWRSCQKSTAHPIAETANHSTLSCWVWTRTPSFLNIVQGATTKQSDLVPKVKSICCPCFTSLLSK